MAGMVDHDMTGARSWRQLIQEATAVLWPGLADGPAWIESQVDAESRGDPRAISPCGALGLLQLMPGTAGELGVKNPLDPSENLRGGITYLRRQYDALEPRVPEHFDRLAWAFASYNAGRGYVLRALGIAEMDAKGFHLPGPRWWSWDRSWPYLFHRQADVNGHWADYHQVVGYVSRIRVGAIELGARVRDAAPGDWSE